MKKEKKKILKDICFLSFLFCFFLFTRLVIQPVTVVGNSMEPTLEEYQMLLADRTVKAEEYERNDIVVVKVDNMHVIKRVIGLPGETVQIIDSNIYINNEKIEDVYVGNDFESRNLSTPITLQNNEFIVLGDNRNFSYDSRDFGPVFYEDFVGRIIDFNNKY